MTTQLSARSRHASPARRSPLEDDLLLAELAALPPLEDAREALRYWQRRLDGLPARRRTARREAAEMVDRWRERVRAAERAHYGPRLRDPLLDLALTAQGLAKRGIALGIKVALVLFVMMTALFVLVGIAVWPEIHAALQVLTGAG